MKIRIQYLATMLAGLVALMADVNAQTNPLPSLERGQGLGLSSEQRTQRRELMQTTVADLHAKKATGTLNAAEQTWLDKAEQRGGICITGTPARGAGRAFTPQAIGTTAPVCPAVEALNARKTAGTLGAADQALLQRMEQFGMQRGRHGRNCGRGMGMGWGRGNGSMDGCPLIGN